MEEATKAVAVLGRPSISKVAKAPSSNDGSGRDARTPVEEAAKAATVLDRLSISQADKVPGGSGGSASPSI